jgi:hypothetical protein
LSTRVSALAPTLVPVIVGLTATAIIPPAYCQGLFIKYASGGSLAIVGAASGVTAANGYVLGSTDLQIDGPAVFYLNAGGATAVASLCFKLSQGVSQFP